jgi:ribosomal protein S18 acetylase RimI-like enzyme
MSEHEITREDEAHGTLSSFLSDQIYEFNQAATGFTDGILMAYSVRDSDGNIIAALTGHTWGGTCEISQLWVDEPHRHQRLGSRLMEEAERIARERGCSQIFLTTHSFQAPDYYVKLGFELCGAIDNYPAEHKFFTMRKLL